MIKTLFDAPSQPINSRYHCGSDMPQTSSTRPVSRSTRDHHRVQTCAESMGAPSQLINSRSPLLTRIGNRLSARRVSPCNHASPRGCRRISKSIRCHLCASSRQPSQSFNSRSALRLRKSAVSTARPDGETFHVQLCGSDTRPSLWRSESAERFHDHLCGPSDLSCYTVLSQTY